MNNELDEKQIEILPLVKPTLRQQAGMTLLEIMIVLAIIATVMGLLFGPAIFGALGESKEKTSRIILSQYSQAYIRWATNSGGTCPSNLEELKKYVASDDVVDGWGNPLAMVCGASGGQLPDNVPFGVVSAGEDGKQGTADDLKSWEKKKKSK